MIFLNTSTIFVTSLDQIKWLKTPSEEFGNQTPLDLIKDDPKNLFLLRAWVDQIANPKLY